MLNGSVQTELMFVALQTCHIELFDLAHFSRWIIDMARKKSSGSATSKPAGKAAARRLPIREFSRSLPMSLLRAREAVMRHFRPSLRDHGLTEQQWRILRALTSIDAIEVTELARVAFLLGPSLSRILRDLEARHLIDRKVGKADQRRAVVSISPRGLRLIEAVAPSSEAIYASMTARYGARKLATLQEMLRALEACLSELHTGDGEEADAHAS
jgi:homoprotocatechuate degradation regulator HpaR